MPPAADVQFWLATVLFDHQPTAEERVKIKRVEAYYEQLAERLNSPESPSK